MKRLLNAVSMGAACGLGWLIANLILGVELGDDIAVAAFVGAIGFWWGNREATA